MASETGFAVEDFLEAITAQLDRAQDGLRFKAEIRPMTYAIRDFSLELKVFVYLDEQGVVRFRPAGPGDTDASTVSMAFTTITRPMIEENTITLAAVRSPSLGELGLAPAEQRSLERIGVRNAEQLRKLSSSSGTDALARFADLPVNRLRAALQAGRSDVDTVSADQQPTTHRPAAGPRAETPIRLPAGTRRLRLDGRNLGDLARTGSAALGGVGVPIVDAGDDHAVIDLGTLDPDGLLEVQLGDGDVRSFWLSTGEADEAAGDPWGPA